MQRVAIFQFNWGRRLALLVILALSILASSLFVYNTHVNAAAATTYKTEITANIKTKIKALKYYYGLNFCTQLGGRDWKTSISGDDIDKGPRWWINGQAATVRLGQYIDSWGNKDGNTACNGESDSEPGWVNDMFSVFGLTLGSDKKATLGSLGYKCTQNGSSYTCTNNDINSTTSKKGILYQARNGSYLNGVNPLSEQPDYNSIDYFLALDSLKTSSMCNAQKGGSSNLVSVSEVQPDGTAVTSDWGIKNDGGLDRSVTAGIPLQDSTGTGNTCQKSAQDTVKYAPDYQHWVGASACASSYPSMANDPNLLSACASGRANPTNYSICATPTFSDNASTNYAMKNACWIGQGLPMDSQGTSSGMLCFSTLGYTSSSFLNACIKGSLNISDTNYCNGAYPAPDIFPNRPTPKDTNADIRAACQSGQSLKVSGGGIPIDNTLSSKPSAAGDKTSCGIEGIGWIVCPVISFMGDLLSHAFSGLADNFLAVDSGLFDTNSGTYIAWAIFRNFANVAFVIVFLIIIFSQLTGVGVSNYGVKKLLPRIVIAAILVNLSYFICQIAVDVSNILGYSLKQIFDGIAVTAAVPTSSEASGNGFGISAIILLVIATATVAYFALAILIPILLGALVGILMVLLMLIARKAIIILLIVLSPLAFVAFLLPNTEPLFKKWRKAFMALLLLFPIISVVFGVSSLASQIVLKAGAGTGSDVVLQIMAVGIASLPFFLVPTLLKGSLNGIGSVGGKLNSFASKAGGNLGKVGSKGFANTALARGRGARQQARSQYRDQKFARSIAKGGARAIFARGANLTGAQKYANQALERSAYSASEKADAEDMSGAEQSMKRLGLTANQRQTVAMGGSVSVKDPNTGKDRVIDGKKDRVMRRAAIKGQSSGMHSHVKELTDQVPTMSAEDRQLFTSSLGASSSKPTWASQGALESLAQGTDPTGGTGSVADFHIANAVAANAYSSEKIATGDKEELDAAFTVASSSLVSSTAKAKLGANARAITGDPRLENAVSKNRSSVSNLQSL